MVHDDGAIIYINGQELTRSEMIPLGVVNHYTYARQSSNATNENNFYTYKVDSSYFVTGLNTIAVSVRNRSASDDDVSFDFIITVCDHASENCPIVTSKKAKRVHCNFNDPSKIKEDINTIKNSFRKTRNEIRDFCKKFILENIS